MYIPEDGHVEVRENIEIRRKLEATGSYETLVIRLSDRNNVQPSVSVSQLEGKMFDNDISLKNQMEACSHGKLKIDPFKGKTSTNLNVENGVVDVKMDFNCVNGANGMASAAMNAAAEKIGSLWSYDLVMFCLPPGSNYQAFAFTNCGYSFFSDEWCGSVSTQMEEIGTNLGLGFSYMDNWYANDETGFMGSSKGLDEERMCYNPQKNYQLGWYSDKAKSIDPLDGNGKHDLVLNGVEDYDRKNDASVVVRLAQSSKVQDYYVGFNRAKGVNADTREDRDMVTIVRKEEGCGASEYGDSYKVASLEPGQEHVIEKFNGEEDVTVRFVQSRKGNAKVSIYPMGHKPDDDCEDAKTRFRLKPGGRTRKCKSWAKAGKCNSVSNLAPHEGMHVWEICGKSCQRCNSSAEELDDEISLVSDSLEHERASSCEDSADGHFSIKDGGKKRSCKSWARASKCKQKCKSGPHEGEYIWNVCRKSCRWSGCR
jgi:hypothetical protein